jgi:hypothetical protein
MQRRRFLSGSAVVAGVGLGMGLGPAALACRLFPAGAADRYVARRAGEQIGWQAFSFRREPGQFVVEVNMEIDFASLQSGGLPYRHESREVWKAGWLQAMQSRTRTGAGVQVVNAQRQDGSLLVDGSDVRPYRLSTYIVPSNLWHRDSRLVDAFIDVENGKLRFAQPRFVAKEPLQQGDGVVQTHRYSIRGQLNREAWYDADCALVRWDLPLADGDWISFRREAV